MNNLILKQPDNSASNTLHHCFCHRCFHSGKVDFSEIMLWENFIFSRKFLSGEGNLFLGDILQSLLQAVNRCRWWLLCHNYSSKWGIWKDHSLICLLWINTCSSLLPFPWAKEVSLLIMNRAWSDPQVLGWHKTNYDLQPCLCLVPSSKIWRNKKK